eukprot:TRINITY_DN73597_c0_g1_i1.p1 TRINITY_DN73597_c0_g1~~TRINITY_DN73597_c0_g1_i1.p1  ORF type:complete len:319 (+),score=55.14 TRINITY_DN73597_c0_g1_i1:104-1060(+)
MVAHNDQQTSCQEVTEIEQQKACQEDHLSSGVESDAVVAHGGSQATTPPREEVGSDCSTELCSEASSEDAQCVDTQAPALIIFDWDDTILPTTWIGTNFGLGADGPRPSDEDQVKLLKLATVAERTLRAAKEHGRVVIVTNGEEGWVQVSCARYLPSLQAELGSLSIVSARSTYQRLGEMAPTIWKVQAFARELEAWRAGASAASQGIRAAVPSATAVPVMGPASQARVGPPAAGTCSRRSVVSLGDAVHEQQALFQVTFGATDCWAKSVKFIERPDVQQLIEQHELVGGCFQQLLEFDGHVEVEVSPEALEEGRALA